jgi:asparagine synthase (glutamine-hydrolysing)
MCGISVLFGPAVTKEMLKKSMAALKARGPDVERGDVVTCAGLDPIAIGFTRLHIQGSNTECEQPFSLSDARTVLCNGEIFNSEFLIRNLGLEVPAGSSDCAVIPALLERGLSLAEVCRQLDGDFAIVVVDLASATVTVARDPYGVRPLYFGSSEGQWRGFVSELKGLPEGATRVLAVEPGTVMTVCLDGSRPATVDTWHQVPWLKNPSWAAPLEAEAALRVAVEEAVAKRLTTVRAVGACLSGGLDSSLVAAIAAKLLAAKGQRLHTYSIGMEGSPDLEHARLVADHIGSIHHERIVTAEECLSLSPTVVKAIESFDITTVRASVGNYLVGQLVATETPDVKVVLNGDGADEVLGGYLYMRAAPDDLAFETETTRLLSEIHRYDVLRSERSMAAHGLESRSPFLDRQFVSTARAIPTQHLRPQGKTIEKNVLRLAFATSGLLPDAVLWRRKEAFSDGISRAEKSWFLLAAAAGEAAAGAGAVASATWSTAAAAYEVNRPKTAEAFWYRRLFHESYPEAAAEAVAPAMWMPRFIVATDPSARTLALYTSV